MAAMCALTPLARKARLTGDLNVVQDKQGLGLNGQINIPEGRFHAYGQDLIVRRVSYCSLVRQINRILISLIRNPDATEDDVIAGVRVTGWRTNRKRRSSDPAMSQQAALSLFATWTRAGERSGDSAAMTSMLIGRGCRKVARLWVKSARRLA
ncbi:hypothetical protein DMI65_18320 [Escherichia coli]|nr:hypothetical protein [Escherichia coli]